MVLVACIQHPKNKRFIEAFVASQNFVDRQFMGAIWNAIYTHEMVLDGRNHTQMTQFLSQQALRWSKKLCIIFRSVYTPHITLPLRS